MHTYLVLIGGVSGRVWQVFGIIAEPTGNMYVSSYLFYNPPEFHS
jgi:hypothetical protein